MEAISTDQPGVSPAEDDLRKAAATSAAAFFMKRFSELSKSGFSPGRLIRRALAEMAFERRFLASRCRPADSRTA
jgi:hypothetical protein